MVDIAAATAHAAAADFGSCDAKFAREPGADYSIIGRVRKVSNLILNMTITIRNAMSGRIVAIKSVDRRGNADATWSRALDWRVRYELSAPKGVFR